MACKDLLIRLREKAIWLWKQGHITWGEYRDAVRTCREGIRKAKAQMKLNLVRDVKNKVNRSEEAGQREHTSCDKQERRTGYNRCGKNQGTQ